jgi:Tol biopolymer transport system component
MRTPARKTLSATAVVAALALAQLPVQAYERPGRTERVSIASDGTEGYEDVPPYAVPAISADGRFVAFASRASTLVAGDTNSAYDIFVHDRVTRITERVSVGPGGVQANGASQWPSLSADGRCVAFHSGAANFVAGATGVQIYVRDRVAGVTELVSVADDGTPGNDDSFASYGPAISGDGRFVVFASKATNFASSDSNATLDVFIRDRVALTTRRISSTPGGAAGDHSSLFPTISADGGTVAFTSDCTDLTGSLDTNPGYDNYVWTRATGLIERVSETYDGTPANGGSGNTPVLSADGRFVAFYSLASNLVPADANEIPDLFVRDRATGITERISVTSDGAEAAANGFLYPYAPAISADGRYVAYSSASANVVPNDTNGKYDMLVHDRSSLTTERVSVAAILGQPNGDSYYTPALSADGHLVAFWSRAANLITNDTNGGQDVFVRDRGPAAGVGSVSASCDTGIVSVSGWATFTGLSLGSADDPADDGSPGAAAAGAELTQASLTYRPESADLMARLRVTSLPPAVAGAPGVLYGFKIAVGAIGIRYEVRAVRAGTNGAPFFVLYNCEPPSCTQVAVLAGGMGTTGDEIVVSVPLSALSASEEEPLSGLRAYAAYGDAVTGPGVMLDEILLQPTTVPVHSVALGIAPAGTPEADVDFDTAASLTNGTFSGTLAGVAPGSYDVWARACLGAACGAASTTATCTGTVGAADPVRAVALTLHGAPSPFRSATRVSYALPAPGRVRLRIVDTQGRLVETLVDAWQAAGEHQIAWNARSRPVGLYWVEISSGGMKRQQKLTLLR